MTSTDPSPFGILLRNHRVAAGLTQEELAEKALLSARAISDLERGVNRAARFHTARQLADALELPEEAHAAFLATARAAGEADRARRVLGEEQPPAVRTFLIADVRNYTRFTEEHGDEAAAHLAMRFTALMDETVQEYDGEVVELRGDQAVAAFHSARQALRAAVEAQRRCAAESSMPLDVGIGLDAGEAIAVGEHGYRGGALNLAARLCAQAGAGEVLASEAVVHLARKVEDLEFVAAAPLSLKGFADPIKPVQVRPVQGTGSVAVIPPAGPLPVGGYLGSLPSGALVARDGEMQQIMPCVEAVCRSEGRLVMLAGEPGVGKTRLAQEVTRLVLDRGFLVAVGRCYEAQAAIPYFPFLEALTTVHATAPPSVRAEAAHRWPYLGRLLPEQLGAAVPPASDSPEEQQRLFRAVTGFLQAIAEHVPVAILLDDLQWADSASLELLHHLARQTRGSGILLLGIYRDVEVNPQHALEATLRDLSREQLMERIPVRRLESDGTAALIAQSLSDSLAAEEEFTTLLHRHTDGNPFFTQQVLRSLIEAGIVYQQNGHWERRAVAEIEVPESVRSVIGQRVARLPGVAQEILHEASVLGQRFTFDDLQAMSGRDEEEIDGALTEAATLGLVRAAGRDDYIFDHALTQQALYVALSPRRRKRLHLAAGKALEGLPERKRTLRAAELARHFLQGDDAERALPYTILAGDRAEEVFAHGEAERHYRAALELASELEDDDARTRAQERLGGVLATQARYQEALPILEHVAGQYHAAGDLEAEGRVVAQIGLIHGYRGRPQLGIDRLQSLAAVLEGRGTSRSLATIYAQLSRLYNMSDRIGDQIVVAQRLWELVADLGDERLLAEAELHRGVALMAGRRYEDALPMLESAIHRSEAVGDLGLLGMSLSMAARLTQSLSGWTRTEEYYERAVEVAERLADPREISFRWLELAYLHFYYGDWHASGVEGERALTAAMILDTLDMYIGPLAHLGELNVFTGNWEVAGSYLQDCVDIAIHLKRFDALREAQGLLAEMDILRGEPGALARLEPLIGTEGWEDHINFLLPLGSAYLESGKTTEAKEIATRALTEATNLRLPIAQIDALRVLGFYGIRQELWSEGENCFRRALGRARHFTYAWGEARSLHGLGLLYLRQGKRERADELLAQARAIFERLGARPYLRQVTEAMQTR